MLRARAGFGPDYFAAATGQLGPLPGAVYGTGTMTQADLYPQIAAIGGIRTQDYTIPPFADSMARATNRALAIGAAEDQVTLTKPAGWLALMIVLLILGAWLID
jgi:hypothetical protein